MEISFLISSSISGYTYFGGVWCEWVYLPDQVGFTITDYPHRSAADWTGLDIDAKDPFQVLRPSHYPPSQCSDFLRLVFAVRRKDIVINGWDWSKASTQRLTNRTMRSRGSKGRSKNRLPPRTSQTMDMVGCSSIHWHTRPLARHSLPDTKGNSPELYSEICSRRSISNSIRRLELLWGGWPKSLQLQLQASIEWNRIFL